MVHGPAIGGEAVASGPGEVVMRFVERDGARVHFDVVGQGPPVALPHALRMLRAGFAV